MYRDKLSLEEKIYEYEDDINLKWKDLEDFDYIILDKNVTSNTKTLRRIN